MLYEVITEPDENHADWYPIGDPTEAALIAVSTKLNMRISEEDKQIPEIYEFSFDSVRKRMSSVRLFNDKRVLMMKGALSSVLSVTKYIYKNGEVLEITPADLKKLDELNEKN